MRTEEAERARRENEQAAMEAARQMWAAGNRAGAKELLFPLLTRDGRPPNGATAQDYVVLALLEATDTGPRAGMQILSQVPDDLVVEPTRETVELVALLGREAISKIDDAAAREDPRFCRTIPASRRPHGCGA